MKKVLTIIAALALAAPVFAQAPQVDIICEDSGLGDGVCTVRYSAAGDVPVAGFAFNIEVGGDTITAIDGYDAQGVTGPTADVPAGYAIYMGSIDFGADPADVDSFGDPVAPATDPDALGGLGTNGITVELGALYEHGVDPAPPQAGILFTITVEDTDGSGDTIVAISEETTRGGIVLEGPAEAAFFSAGCTLTHGPGVCVKDTAPFYQTWLNWGSPACWCYEHNQAGDADGLLDYGSFPVFAPDLGVLVAAYGKDEATLATVANGICADFDRGMQYGTYRVFTDDLAILVANYGKALPAGDMTNYNFWMTP